MVHYRSIFSTLCLIVAVKGEHESISKLRGSNGDRDLAPVDELKTYIVKYKTTDSGTMSIASTLTYSTAESVGGAVIFNYDAVLNGAAVTLTASAAEQLKTSSTIDYVVESKPVSIAWASSWGLDRIDQTDLPLDNNYRYWTNTNAGAGINVCDIDTGIDEDYVGGDEIKIAGGADFVGTTVGTNPWNDCNGHGTHVAGTIGSRTYGVAPGVTLWAVRVLDCGGSGEYAGVIAGINWCVAKAKEIGGKWVANMSLGAWDIEDTALTQAVADARMAGVVMVVAAGNDNIDACEFTPAREPLAVTVGSSNILDKKSGFSNFGTCIDIFAPGSGITSLWLKEPGQPTQSLKISGTSMASPHVAGTVALYFMNASSADAVEAALFAGAATGKLFSNIQPSSPNLLLQVPLTIPTPAPTPAPVPAPTPAPAPTPKKKPKNPKKKFDV